MIYTHTFKRYNHNVKCVIFKNVHSKDNQTYIKTEHGASYWIESKKLTEIKK